MSQSTIRQQSMGISLNTPIDRIVLMISTRLELNDGHDYKLERWIKLLKDNWIQTVGALTRLNDGQLDKLNLPLGLKFELEKIGKLQFEQHPFFHVVQESLISDTRYQLKLSEKQKEHIHHSFKLLLKYHDHVTELSGLRRFEKEFFGNFFKVNPGAARLFNEKNLELQSKAFVKMLYWIVENMETLDLSSVVIQLGGRHVIYQVAAEEFDHMSRALTDTLVGILGTKVFSSEVTAAWRELLKQMAALLIMGGAQCEKGIQKSVKRLKGKGAWEVCYFHLLLDVFYIYKDKNMKTLVGQYPLKGVNGVEVIKVTEQRFALNVSSFDPPFTVSLAVDDAEQFKEIISEFTWRTQAIQRAFCDDATSLHLSGSTETSNSEDETTTTNSTAKAVKPERTKNNKTLPASKTDGGESSRSKKKAAITHSKSVKRQENIAPKAQEIQLELDGLLKKGLNLTAEQKVILKTSWTTLIEKKYNDDNGVTKSGIGMLFDRFFQTFFQENPSGRRLFEHSGLQVQGRALVLMIGMIIKSLDSFSVFAEIVVQLGGRHEIYGVNEGDYECFARVLSKSVGDLLGENNEDVKKAWYDCMISLSQIMSVSQKIAVNSKEFVVCHRKFGQTSNSWKQAAIRFSLDSIYIFNGVEATKLRSAINMKLIKEVELIPKGEVESSFPTPHVFIVTHGDGEKAYFAFDTAENCVKQMESLSWRVQAQQRVYKYDAEESGDDHSGSNVSDNKSSAPAKKLGFLKKKTQQSLSEKKKQADKDEKSEASKK